MQEFIDFQFRELSMKCAHRVGWISQGSLLLCNKEAKWVYVYIINPGPPTYICDEHRDADRSIGVFIEEYTVKEWKLKQLLV